jgi:hypothetical protein
MYILLLQVIVIAVLYITYAYLASLNTCACVNQVYAHRLKQGEIVFLGLALIPFVISLLHSVGLLKGINLDVRSLLVQGGLVIAVAVLVFYIWFAYNSYKFAQTMEADCKCAKKAPRYVVYFQGFTVAATLVMSVLASVYAIYNKIPIVPSIIAATQKQAVTPLKSSLRRIKRSKSLSY